MWADMMWVMGPSRLFVVDFFVTDSGQIFHDSPKDLTLSSFSSDFSQCLSLFQLTVANPKHILA